MSVDLSSRYLGLSLCSPIIASASPLTRYVGAIRQFADAGAGAVVLPSLFEEQIEKDARLLEQLISIGSDSSPEVTSYFPSAARYNTGPGGYLDLIARARAAVKIPIIASLNGTTKTGWIEYARQIEQAGASALELNIYQIMSDPGVTGAIADAAYIGLVKAVRAAVKIPIAVKLHPYFSAFGSLARELDQAGADGLVLFNRLYQPDIDLVRLGWKNDALLSGKGEIRLGLLWLSLLSGRLPHASLAAGTGVETADEIIKYILAGADVVMTTSALLRGGAAHLNMMLRELERWLAARGFKSVDEIKGLLRREDQGHEARIRGDYITTLLDYRVPGHSAPKTAI